MATRRDIGGTAWRGRVLRTPPADAGQPDGGTRLRRRLLIGDVLALALGWCTAFAVALARSDVTLPLLMMYAGWAVLGVAAQLVFMMGQRLHIGRTVAVRSVEIQLLFRASAVTCLVLFAAKEWFDLRLPGRWILLGGVLAAVLLVLWRSAYREWVGRHRRAGRFGRPVVLVGINDEAMAMHNLLAEHPELGFDLVGVVGARAAHERSPLRSLRWLGELRDTEEAIADAGATGVLVVASAVGADALNDLVRRLGQRGLHVHVSSGLTGISADRLRVVPLAYEPVFYLEPVVLSRAQEMVKQGLDYLVAAVAAVLSAPVLLVAIAAIKLEDGGPVLFRQRRVGQDGTTFTCYKLRTMVVGAEALQAALAKRNERRDGPLFKLGTDPRVTRVGAVLRATSIDELPQLFNVLNGTMSIVGPRPALPDEVAKFDARLQERTRVRPGVTGLWQVEARDNPAFGAYRRLDLFYAENWSVGLDLAIMFATVVGLVMRVRTQPLSVITLGDETDEGGREPVAAAWGHGDGAR